MEAEDILDLKFFLNIRLQLLKIVAEQPSEPNYRLYFKHSANKQLKTIFPSWDKMWKVTTMDDNAILSVQWDTHETAAEQWLLSNGQTMSQSRW